MRLLQHSKNGDFSLIEAFEDDIPTYAILSHRWGVEEITYQDLTGGTYKRKAGYTKMRFCSQQAQHDGLQHFWIDTCCIDKTNSTELAEAINSMFSWYRRAAKCYVYMPDVLQPRSDPTEKSSGDWNADFRKSEWFTRGWTLQELVAPASVEFFSKEGTRLGDKVSLEKLVSDITRIPGKALRGSPLFEFSIHERMSWAADRKTFRPEDKAYSLLGIFNVHMPLLYSEGVDKAMQRLREEIDKASKGVNREDFLIPISLVDAPHLEHFVARKTELLEIHKALSGDGSRRTVILHGLGGIGKTQLSVAYAKHYRHSYSAVFWLNIDDENAIKQSFVKLARQINQRYPSALRLADTNSREMSEEAIEAVKMWLSRPNNTRWLMIFDNYDNPKLPSSNADSLCLDIRQYLPEAYQGSIIITTRSSQIRIGHSIQIQKFDSACDSLEILTSVSKRDELKDDPDIMTLVEKLDGLPLALATAGSYLNQVTLTVSDYMRLYDDSWAQLQQSSPRLDSYEDRTFYSTWQLSFDQIRLQNELSAKLLGFWAYFDSQDLWLELLQHTDSTDPEWIRELTKDEIGFHEAIRVLSNYGLVETNTSTYSSEMSESGGYSLHRCVHSWAHHVLNQSWDQELAGLAAKLVTSHVSKYVCSSLLPRRRVLQHALKCSSTMLNGLKLDHNAYRLHHLGCFFASLQRPIESEKMYLRALKEKEVLLGPEHPSVFQTMFELGQLYGYLDRLTESENMYQRALRGYEDSVGPDHESTLLTVSSLAAFNTNQYRLAEAEKLYTRALGGYEKLWGSSERHRTAWKYEHIPMLNTISSLGILYILQDRLTEAEEMHQRAIHGFEVVRGPDHVSTLSATTYLAGLYATQHKFVEAEQMYQRALKGYEVAYGSDSHTNLNFNFAILNLGKIYRLQNELTKAEQMIQQALQNCTNCVDQGRTLLSSTLRDLGAIYTDQNRVVEGEEKLILALRGFEKTLGPNHISTIEVIVLLATNYLHQGDLNEAEKLFQRALESYQNTYGCDHRLTLSVVTGLANVYKEQGKLFKAEQLYKGLVQEYEGAFCGNKIISKFNNFMPEFWQTPPGLDSYFENQNAVARAKIMYEFVKLGYWNIYGSLHIKTRVMDCKWFALDRLSRRRKLKHPGEAVDKRFVRPAPTPREPVKYIRIYKFLASLGIK